MPFVNGYSSKSIFTNTSTIKRTLLIPINEVPVIYAQYTTWSAETDMSGNCCPSIPPSILTTIQDIKSLYSTNLASNNYQNIPTDYEKYLDLLFELNSYTSFPCDSLGVMLSIVKDALIASSKMSTLFQTNNELTMTVSILNKKIDDILSGINKIKAIGNVEGTLEFKKTIKLAPLYSFYIVIFGLPAFGVGFNQDAISALNDIIDNYGQNTLSYYLSNFGVPNLGDGSDPNKIASFKTDIAALADILIRYNIPSNEEVNNTNTN